MQEEGLQKGMQELLQVLPGLVGASHDKPEQVEEHITDETPLSQVTLPNIPESPLNTLRQRPK